MSESVSNQHFCTCIASGDAKKETLEWVLKKGERWTTTARSAQHRTWRQGNSWAQHRQPFCLHSELSFLFIHIVILVFSHLGSENSTMEDTLPLSPIENVHYIDVANYVVTRQLLRGNVQFHCNFSSRWQWCIQCWSFTSFPTCSVCSLILPTVLISLSPSRV